MNLSFLNSKTPLEAAMYYANDLGWPVFPIWNVYHNGKCACGNPECNDTGKHPIGAVVPNGLKNATTKLDLIRKWWGLYPEANIGVTTGRGIFVLDVDARDGGMENFTEIPSLDPNLPKSLSCKTGGGGRHYYLRVPTDYGELGNGRLRSGIDYKSDGGYVLAPPSIHYSKSRYQWEDAEASIEEMSATLVKAVLTKRGTRNLLEISENSSLPINEGGRNETLYSLAASFRAYGRPLDMALDDLRSINQKRCVPPMHDEEVVGIVQRAYQKPPSFIFSDLGNAEMLKHYHGENVVWTVQAGWLAWEDGCWQKRTEEEMHKYCHLVTRLMWHAAIEHNDPPLKKHASSSMNAGKLSGMAKEWRTLQVGDFTVFDRNPMLLPCLNGTYDLERGVFREARKEDYMLSRIPVEYKKDVACPTWEAAMRKWVDNDEELLSSLQRLAGYILTGDIRHQTFFILYGPGGTGKSTFTQTMQMLLGNYSVTISTDLLMKSSNINRETEKMRLFGKRLAVCPEGGRTSQIHTETLKALTGSDKISGRNLYEKSVNFDPTHKMIFFTNDLPKLPAGDSGVWRRIKLIPFKRVITADEKDPTLLLKLSKELSGILNWALAGCNDWMQRGDLAIASRVLEETEGYRRSQDRIGQFLREFCEEDPEGRAPGSELYQAYRVWCAEGGYQFLGRNNFFGELESHDVVRRINVGTSPVFVGVKIKDYRRLVVSG